MQLDGCHSFPGSVFIEAKEIIPVNQKGIAKIVSQISSGRQVHNRVEPRMTTVHL